MANGLIHDIHSGETLLDIADRYDSTLQAILAANEISDPNAISVRAQIFIPHAKVPKPEAPAQTGPAPSPTSQSNAPVPLSIDTPVPTATPRPASVSQSASVSSASASSAGSGGSSASSSSSSARASGGGLIWPITGPLSSFYGPSHPLGIDIDLFNRSGAPIGAAGAGVVTFAGGDPCCSYGLYVDIDHGNGLTTRYAHLSRIAVSKGQKVSAGQTIGFAGSTGYSTGTHLHFEVHRNGATVNPMSYLP
jgi:murein DD-endopeptidase MepM/ murein hydrolase activator NlpD